MSTFPPIADYAFLSDCEHSCLVAPDGSVEWLCLPRPDSPSIFGALLDRTAGTFRLGPTNVLVPDQRRYLPGTMVLETTWHTPTGWVIVNDFLVIKPVQGDKRRPEYRRAPSDAAATGTLVRTATCTSGRVEVLVNCLPLFSYGTTAGQWSYDGEGYQSATVRAGESQLKLTSSLRLALEAARAYGRTTLETGQSAFIAASWLDYAPTTIDQAALDALITTEYWRNWLAGGDFPDHPWRQWIERSALTLKGLSYAPTGAIMAASTTGLPETPGGERNWDYRYTWIRDSGFMLRSLYRLGFDWEALEYFAFVLDAVSGGGQQKGDYELQIMYGIGGERDLTERTLDHLTGYQGARPVRIGNGAWNQRQNDVWGMLLDAVDTYLHRGAAQIVQSTWEGLASFVDTAIERFDDPDQGIWEVRGDPKHFTASKVLCWVAAEKGANLAVERGDKERADRWQAAADKMKAEVLDKGVDDRGRFRQEYENDELDAALLLIPILGFLPPDDKRVQATVLAIADELTEDGLVLRYKVDSTDTGFSGKEGTFNICSFWLVEALTRAGRTDPNRLEDARLLFEQMLGYANHLGLYSEQTGTSGEALGNFPQAFTHLALISAAFNLDRALGSRGAVP